MNPLADIQDYTAQPNFLAHTVSGHVGFLGISWQLAASRVLRWWRLEPSMSCPP